MTIMFKSWIKLTTLMILFSASFISCEDDDMPTNPTVKPDVVFYALSGGNTLVRYNANATTTAQATMGIAGMQPGESMLSIDFRPATGELYGLGSTSRLYIINITTGAARALGASSFTPALTAATAEIDFNPTVDRIRLVGADGQNLRLNPETGTVAAVDLPINGVAGAVVSSVAYVSNFAGATTTTLFDIDVATNKLYKQIPANSGTLALVGDLTVDPNGVSGFDISPTGDAALAILNVAGANKLYSIDTASGKATLIGGFSTGVTPSAIAIPTTKVAYGVDLNNNLVIFNPLAAGNVINKTITGIGVENILGIDFRPATSQLYALSSSSKLYTINLSSGAATQVGTVGSFVLTGTSFGFDFNPTVDRIRIVSNTGQNLRANPTDGTAIVDAMLNPGTPAVTAAAYTNNFATATTTMLFVIDNSNNTLYNQNPANAGTLIAVGALGVTPGTSNGFDIGGTSNNAYAVLTVGATTSVYTINTTTGAATKVYDLAAALRGFALSPSL